MDPAERAIRCEVRDGRLVVPRQAVALFDPIPAGADRLSVEAYCEPSTGGLVERALLERASVALERGGVASFEVALMASPLVQLPDAAGPWRVVVHVEPFVVEVPPEMDPGTAFAVGLRAGAHFLGALGVLVGEVVQRLFVGPGETTLYVETERGVLSFGTFADCCSVTWLADVTGTEALIGATVLEAVALEMVTADDGRSRQSDDEVYGFELRTSRGRATLAFRNSSNGYYGGAVEPGTWVDGVPVEAREITDDWSA